MPELNERYVLVTSGRRTPQAFVGIAVDRRPRLDPLQVALVLNGRRADRLGLTACATDRRNAHVTNAPRGASPSAVRCVFRNGRAVSSFRPIIALLLLRLREDATRLPNRCATCVAEALEPCCLRPQLNLLLILLSRYLIWARVNL